MKNISRQSVMIAVVALVASQLFAAKLAGAPCIVRQAPKETPPAMTRVQRMMKKNIQRFMTAAREFDVATLTALISSGINPNVLDESGKTAYYHCAKAFLFIRNLSDENKALMHDTKERDRLECVVAAIKERFRQARWLLDSKGAKGLSSKEIAALRQEYVEMRALMPAELRLSDFIKI
jgi:hypothetical protein